MPHLGLNIDHVATLRQARRGVEPDPVWAAVEGQLAGAQCITVHLREDRRHIQDHDLERIKGVCQVKLNLEMAATPGMVKVARATKPHMATLVPEGRQEVTTEGGLDVAQQLRALKRTVGQLQDAGISVSAFIDPEPRQIEAAAKAGFAWCEVHTGPYAHAFAEAGGDLSEPRVARALDQVAEAGRLIVASGMRFNAGHALNYHNVQPIARLGSDHDPGNPGNPGNPGTGAADPLRRGAPVQELHIGHAIISRAVFVGLRQAVAAMLDLLNERAS